MRLASCREYRRRSVRPRSMSLHRLTSIQRPEQTTRHQDLCNSRLLIAGESTLHRHEQQPRRNASAFSNKPTPLQAWTHQQLSWHIAIGDNTPGAVLHLPKASCINPAQTMAERDAERHRCWRYVDKWWEAKLPHRHAQVAASLTAPSDTSSQQDENHHPPFALWTSRLLTLSSSMVRSH
ncbi:hypothetical protein AC579_1912 [Pseudocercospora musae]|uniref:Uncharacterized protein n=1 Tax=Pseudocercospora musae TaxID=113226 RepID=A0A139HFJ4_9PEZI|nr:hypothetical protein AC579_1912 [Pseudocercospora musae]KXT01199.1 hypothetical protein AC579_1912 [Pseudocercospora musae]